MKVVLNNHFKSPNICKKYFDANPDYFIEFDFVNVNQLISAANSAQNGFHPAVKNILDDLIKEL